MRSSETITGTVNPDFNFRKQFTIQSVSSQFLEYLEKSAMIIEVCALQFPAVSSIN
jgi:hypothetical protein